MSPFLEAKKSIGEVSGDKFVRIGDQIYHSFSYYKHRELAKRAGFTETDDWGSPLIDDGGYIQNVENKFAFSGFTKSCKIKDNPVDARNKTIEVARKILGEDKVH